uniref:Uncharacterized protein n=1 Tax=Tanacetum cinerariifolium TaxID=118510 RepID=A0A699L9V9_TANCI|nr:hypothetical protein [Tanacetum cinerariifolium]
MVNITIQQELSSISIMSSPIIDLTSRPESPKEHQQLKATTTNTTTTTTATLPPPQAPQQSMTEAVMVKLQSSGSGITFLLAVAFFCRQWEVPSGSENFLTSSGNALKDAINHLVVLESLQSCKSSKLDHFPFVKNSPLKACSRSLQGLDPSSEDSPSLLA